MTRPFFIMMMYVFMCYLFIISLWAKKIITATKTKTKQITPTFFLLFWDSKHSTCKFSYCFKKCIILISVFLTTKKTFWGGGGGGGGSLFSLLNHVTSLWMYDSTVMPCEKDECCVPPSNSILNICHSFSTDWNAVCVVCWWWICHVFNISADTTLQPDSWTGKPALLGHTGRKNKPTVHCFAVSSSGSSGHCFTLTYLAVRSHKYLTKAIWPGS